MVDNSNNNSRHIITNIFLKYKIPNFIILLIIIIFTNCINSIEPNYQSSTPRPEYALEFDGIDDWVVVSDNDGLLDNLSTQLTFEAWIFIKGADHTDNPRIIDRSDNLYNDRIAMIIRDESLQVVLNINGNTLFSNVVPLDTWMHVAGTYDGSTMKIYVNGELHNSRNVSTIIDVTESDLYIGHAVPGSASDAPFQGFIDEVRIWNIARIQESIQTTMNRCLIPEKDLISYWRMNTGFGQRVVDICRRYHGQLGSTSISDENDPVWSILDLPNGMRLN